MSEIWFGEAVKTLALASFSFLFCCVCFVFYFCSVEGKLAVLVHHWTDGALLRS